MKLGSLAASALVLALVGCGQAEEPDAASSQSAMKQLTAPQTFTHDFGSAIKNDVESRETFEAPACAKYYYGVSEWGMAFDGQEGTLGLKPERFSTEHLARVYKVDEASRVAFEASAVGSRRWSVDERLVLCAVDNSGMGSCAVAASDGRGVALSVKAPAGAAYIVVALPAFFSELSAQAVPESREVRVELSWDSRSFSPVRPACN